MLLDILAQMNDFEVVIIGTAAGLFAIQLLLGSGFGGSFE